MRLTVNMTDMTDTIDPAMEPSSRIFVRGLPPTMNDIDFKKHFGKYAITDTRLFPQRRIGYVGYKTPEDAAKAVKYFNRTFIRMSKIGVELARPVRLLVECLLGYYQFRHVKLTLLLPDWRGPDKAAVPDPRALSAG